MQNSYPNLTTEQLASLLGLRPTSIRVRLCESGSYFGLRPLKLPNGRLLWPSDALERLSAYRAEKSGGAA